MRDAIPSLWQRAPSSSHCTERKEPAPGAGFWPGKKAAQSHNVGLKSRQKVSKSNNNNNKKVAKQALFPKVITHPPSPPHPYGSYGIRGKPGASRQHSSPCPCLPPFAHQVPRAQLQGGPLTPFQVEHHSQGREFPLFSFHFMGFGIPWAPKAHVPAPLPPFPLVAGGQFPVFPVSTR